MVQCVATVLVSAGENKRKNCKKGQPIHILLKHSKIIKGITIKISSWDKPVNRDDSTQNNCEADTM